MHFFNLYQLKNFVSVFFRLQIVTLSQVLDIDKTNADVRNFNRFCCIYNLNTFPDRLCIFAPKFTKIPNFFHVKNR